MCLLDSLLEIQAMLDGHSGCPVSRGVITALTTPAGQFAELFGSGWARDKLPVMQKSKI
jgi:hypothetical protein